MCCTDRSGTAVYVVVGSRGKYERGWEKGTTRLPRSGRRETVQTDLADANLRCSGEIGIDPPNTEALDVLGGVCGVKKPSLVIPPAREVDLACKFQDPPLQNGTSIVVWKSQHVGRTTAKGLVRVVRAAPRDQRKRRG